MPRRKSPDPLRAHSEALRGCLEKHCAASGKLRARVDSVEAAVARLELLGAGLGAGARGKAAPSPAALKKVAGAIEAVRKRSDAI